MSIWIDFYIYQQQPKKTNLGADNRTLAASRDKEKTNEQSNQKKKWAKWTRYDIFIRRFLVVLDGTPANTREENSVH